MDKTKKIILVSIIILIVIIFIGLIFYGPKLTKKPAPIVEEKPTKIESLPKIEKIRKFKIVDYDKIECLLLSPNGQYAGIKYYKNDKVYIQINEKLYGPYEVNIWSPKYGTDASHIKLTFFNDSHYIWNFSEICKK
jgi:flagellar basal body-associated protein FliL